MQGVCSAHAQAAQAIEPPLASFDPPGAQGRSTEAGPRPDECVQRHASFRAFYICCTGMPGRLCGTLTTVASKTRPTEHRDWYCRCCGAMFKTNYGMVVELRYTRRSYWLSALLLPRHPGAPRTTRTF